MEVVRAPEQPRDCHLVRLHLWSPLCMCGHLLLDGFPLARIVQALKTSPNSVTQKHPWEFVFSFETLKIVILSICKNKSFSNWVRYFEFFWCTFIRSLSLRTKSDAFQLFCLKRSVPLWKETGCVWLDRGQTTKLFHFTKPALSSSDTLHFIAGVFYIHCLM